MGRLEGGDGETVREERAGGRNDRCEEREKKLDGLRERKAAHVRMMNLSHELIVHLSTFLPVTIQHIS